MQNEQLRAKRELRGWSQEDLVRELVALGIELGERQLGVTRAQVSRWEHGINHPRAPYPKLLCRVFNATAEELGLVPPSPSSTASITTLNRRFREQASTTPLQRLRRARVRHAQYLLESTTHPVDRIAAQVGFGSPTAFRERFKRVVGTSPHAYRIAFRGQNS